MSDPDADDLTTLFSTREATIAGRAVTVRELTFPQSMALNARMAPVIEALLPHYGAEGDGIDSDTLLAALAAQPDVALEMLTLSTGQPAEWLAALPEHEGMHLLLLCVAVHVPFRAAAGNAAPGAGADRRAGGGARVGELFARLIRHGHDQAALGGYTVRQMRLYEREALAAEAAARADRIEEIAVAIGAALGDGKGLQKLLDSLRRRR